jgi:RimJ/RimL family protein N-acetyltransferase
MMPLLESARLIIRPFSMLDLEDVHHLLDIELGGGDRDTESMDTLSERKKWLEWTVLNYEQLAKLHQPPYGDRAVILKSAGKLIGVCGFVPSLLPFEQLPGFEIGSRSRCETTNTTEFGLFYAISPIHQRRGYATEAARIMVDYAFQHLHVKRVIATTDYDNIPSMAVMCKLGMRIKKNPYPEPPWLQVVGVIESDELPNS